jgi:VWFA-related protein
MRQLCMLIGIIIMLPFSAGSRPGAQEPQPVQSQTAGTTNALPTAATRAADRQITLDVQVTDKSGAPILGLQQQDFTLLDDKLPRNILSFQAVNSAAAAAADPPVEIVLVIDAVNSPVLTVTYERDQIRKFLLQNGGALSHPVSLVLFSDDGTKVLKDFTRDGSALAAVYDQFQTGLRTTTRAQGFYGAADRFNLSLKAFTSLAGYETAQPGRKLLIWISPGWPLLSGPNVQISSKNAQALFDTIVEDSSKLSHARMTPYTIDPLGSTDDSTNQYFKEFVKGVSSSSQTVPANLALQVLTVQNGGRVVTSTNDLTAAIGSCARDGDDFYVLTFSAPPADRANEYHSLEVKVDKPGTAVRTRTGYYAQR